MNHELTRVLLARRVAEFSGPPREHLALREATRLLYVRFQNGPIDIVERRMLLARLNDAYRDYSPAFRSLYRDMNLFFAAELNRMAADIQRAIDRLDAESVKYIHTQEEQE